MRLILVLDPLNKITYLLVMVTIKVTRLLAKSGVGVFKQLEGLPSWFTDNYSREVSHNVPSGGLLHLRKLIDIRII